MTIKAELIKFHQDRKISKRQALLFEIVEATKNLDAQIAVQNIKNLIADNETGEANDDSFIAQIEALTEPE